MQRVVDPAHGLQQLGVGRRGHGAAEREGAVLVQHLGLREVLLQLGVLQLVVGDVDFGVLQVPRHRAVVRRVPEPVEVQHHVAVCQRAHRLDRCVGRVLHKKLEQEARNADGGLGELARVVEVDGDAVAGEGGAADLAQDGEEVRLEVARVACELGRHVPRPAGAVDQEVLVEVEGHLARADAVHVVHRQLVDVLPEVVEHAPRAVRVVARVVALVLLHVLAVPVVALQQQEPGELFVAVPLDVREPAAERVVVDEGLVRQDLEGGEVRVDAARHQHLLRRHKLQQVLVQHVLTLIQHVVQHVHALGQHGREELRHRVVV